MEENEKERELFEEERRRAPHLFEREPLIDGPEILSWIGIEGIKDYPVGYIKLFPEDFIVEEISLDKTLHTIEPTSLSKHAEGQGATYYADVVKVGMSTLEMKERLRKILGVDIKHIGFAGIKDRNAITSQHASFRNISDSEVLKNIEEEQFFLKNIFKGKGIISRGDLSGNRFIITVRTVGPLDSKEQDRIKRHLQTIEKDGFWNFFSFQRFGTPRLISHILGLHLLKKEHEETVKTFITHQSLREIPIFRNLRKDTEDNWENWDYILTSMRRFSFQFPHELILLEHLVGHPNDFVGALKKISDQVTMWIYAYTSFLFNKKLSSLIQKGDVPLFLPLAISSQKEDQEVYKELLKEDRLPLPLTPSKDFSFVRFVPRTVHTLQTVEIHSVKFLDKMMVIAFSLQKGAYATTFLANFFQLASDIPIPKEIERKEIDAKELLMMGSLKEVRMRFHLALDFIKREKGL